MRDHPLKISLEHRYPGSLNESTVTLHSPVDGEEKDVGRASWTSHFASNSGSVELEIDLRVADLRASGYKHKPADQASAGCLCDFIQGRPELQRGLKIGIRFKVG